MDKTEFPTAQRLKELREDGIVAYSERSQYFLATFTFLSFVYLTRDALKKILDAFFRYPITKQSEGLQPLAPLVVQATEYLLQGTLLVVACLCLWGVFQTLALFAPHLLSMRFERFTQNFSFSASSLVPRCLRTLLTAFILIVVFGLCLALVMWSLPVLFAYEPVRGGEMLEQKVKKGVLALLLLSGFFAVLSLFVDRYAFLFRHRMSRREIEDEGTES